MDAMQQRYLKAIHSRVCHSCSQLSQDQQCQLSERVCPVEDNLEQIVQIAPYVRSDSARPYFQEMRETVCAACGSVGVCWAHDLLNCPVDRYLEMVFEAIEEVHEEVRSEAEATVH